MADSAIEGRGLVTTTAVAAGTVVMRLGGRLVGTHEMLRLVAEADAGRSAYVDTVTVDDDLHLVLPPRQDVGYGNHSCDPTVWHVDAFTLIARRDIEAGEEITVDYATQTAESSFAMACRCGSPLCRGRVTGDDWRRRDLQQRCGDHWGARVAPPAYARTASRATRRPGPPRLGSGACLLTTRSGRSSAYGHTPTTRPTSAAA